MWDDLRKRLEEWATTVVSVRLVWGSHSCLWTLNPPWQMPHSAYPRGAGRGSTLLSTAQLWTDIAVPLDPGLEYPRAWKARCSL